MVTTHLDKLLVVSYYCASRAFIGTLALVVAINPCLGACNGVLATGKYVICISATTLVDDWFGQYLHPGDTDDTVSWDLFMPGVSIRAEVFVLIRSCADGDKKRIPVTAQVRNAYQHVFASKSEIQLQQGNVNEIC